MMKRLVSVTLLLAATGAFAQPPQQPPQGMDLGALFLKQYDADNDGSVTLEEFQAPMEQQFKMIDTNKDGRISSDEASAFASMMQQHMQQRMKQMGGSDAPR